MTDEQQPIENTEAQPQQPVEDVNDLKQQLEALRNKTQELLDEKKKVQQKAREAEEAAERERLEKAKKNGDYEQLLKSSEKERETLSKELEALRTNIASEKVRTEAMKIAAELADGTNAELLSEFVQRRIKYTQDGVKVLDADGNLTVSSLTDLKNELVNSGRFNSLLRGNKASGGGASGSGSGATKPKTIDRASFESKTPSEKMNFIKEGGKVTD